MRECPRPLPTEMKRFLYEEGTIREHSAGG